MNSDVEYTSSNISDYDETQNPMIRYYFGEKFRLCYLYNKMDDSYNGTEFPKTNALGFRCVDMQFL